jgi:hypothetical protein
MRRGPGKGTSAAIETLFLHDRVPRRGPPTSPSVPQAGGVGQRGEPGGTPIPWRPPRAFGNPKMPTPRPCDDHLFTGAVDLEPARSTMQ